MTAINILTTIAVDDSAATSAHYPQIPFLSRRERRLVYWKCATVFFRTSIESNRNACHYLITNDPSPPLIDGVDISSYLVSIGVKVVWVPFSHFRPDDSRSRIFRNNFYKLTALLYAVHNMTGFVYLFDSDVVWLHQWPTERPGLYLYKAFSRPANEKSPTGISSQDLARMYASLQEHHPLSAVDWCGGEFIGGDCQTLLDFISRAEVIFLSWHARFDSNRHRFENGSSIFDNDEFLLSYVAREFKTQYTQNLKRVWTDETGGGHDPCLHYSALHLPNEKLRGFAGLFDDLVLLNKPCTPKLILEWCAIPLRQRHYQSRSLRAKLSHLVVHIIKSLMPRSVYNVIRACFGRAPIS